MAAVRSASLTSAAVTIFMVMITLYVRIELQFSRQQCPHRRICISGNTTVQPDSGLC